MNGVALLHPAAGDPAVASLARALRAAGGRVVELRPRSGGLDALLRIRKLGDDLGRLPHALMLLRASRCRVAHAFTAADALAAVAWARRAGGAAVFTVTVPPRREELAARRLRLATTVRALAGSTAVVAAGPEVAHGLERWLGVRAPVIAPDPPEAAAAAYLELYRRVA